MLVLAHMMQRMNSQQRQQAVECPCGYEIQNMQHVLSGEFEYMEDSLQHMYLTVDGILLSEGESVQQCWLLAQYNYGGESSSSSEYGCEGSHA